MSLQDIAALGKLLGQFLSWFADCFRRPAGRLLLAVYVRGLLSNVQRKNVEALALAQGVVVRNFHVWLAQPIVRQKPPKHPRKTGRRAKYPRLARRQAPPCEVQNLARYSPGFREQQAQKYRIQDTCRGPEVFEIKWYTCWRKTHTSGLVSRQGTLIVARNVLTGETKYFFSNRVPGRYGWTLRDLLRVAFGRCQVEACFREVKEELGWDHFECRGWRCIHRHLYVTILSGLFCARVRQRLSPSRLTARLPAASTVTRRLVELASFFGSQLGKAFDRRRTMGDN